MLSYVDDTHVGRFLTLSVLLTSTSNRDGLIRIKSCPFRNPGLGIIHRQESVRQQEKQNPGSKEQ